MTHFSVGIDLGTTNSALAVIGTSGIPEIVANREGKKLTPSVVQIGADGSLLVGEQARNALALEIEDTAQFFKRDMGTDTAYWYRTREYTPVELSAAVLTKLVEDAAERLGERPARAVITVPAYFQDRAREATIEAARRAGLEVIQILNEPTAAILFHGMRSTYANPAREEIALVFDLGGGTFDISLARVTAAGIDVIATGGNQRLGGKDWDDRLVDMVCRESMAENGVDPRSNLTDLPLLAARCEEAKKQLSSLTKTTLALHVEGKMSRIEITREAFEAHTRDLLEQTALLMDDVVREAGLKYQQVSRVLLVGGSTRMPMCASLVKARTGLAPDQTMNPDECVTLGAALRAHQLTASGGLSVRHMRDVMGHSVGMIAVSADGEQYKNSIMIAKNQPIPSRSVQSFHAETETAGDNTIAVYVTQGETTDPHDCDFAAKFVIGGIPHSTGGALLDIGYAYNADGVIHVSATERQSGKQLDVRKEAIPQDMSWVYGSPKASARVERTIYAAVDLSGSMSGEPLSEAQKALHAFVDKTDLNCTSFGLIAFANDVKLILTATKDARQIKKVIDSLNVVRVGGGNAGHPFDVARNAFPADGPRFLLVLTDGVWECRQTTAVAARQCHALGIEIIAIGYGSVDRHFLRTLSTADEAVLNAPYGSLVNTFGRIARELGQTGVGTRHFDRLTALQPQGEALRA